MTKQQFLHDEHVKLDRFLGDHDSLVSWWREYKCDCGFACNAARDIWDHAQTCGKEIAR